jgi:thymidine kinase
LASKIIELDTVCECGNKAIISARLINGTVVTESNVVDIGGDEKYKAMCYSCWKKLKDSGDT